jgi:hypothetical protein
LLLVILLGTCGSSVYLVNSEPGVTPAAALASTPVPSIPPTYDKVSNVGWSSLQPGLERRVIEITNDQNQQVESVHVWRLDQRYFRLDVAFDGTPKSLDTWQSETNALMVVNGGFYSIENERFLPDGLIILNGGIGQL